MKALILDMNTTEGEFKDETRFGRIDTKVLNRPLFVHHIENLKKQGVTEFTLLSGQSLPDSYIDGKRWGIELEVLSKLDPTSIHDDEWLIIPGNYLVSFQIKTRQQDAPKAEKLKGWTSISNGPEYFYPMHLNLKKALDEAEQRTELTPNQLFNLIERLDSTEVHRYTDAKMLGVNDYMSLWKSSQELLNTDLTRENLAGFPLKDGIWGDVDTRVDESCTVNGFVQIGKSSRVQRNVELKGLVVIGDNVVIDEGTVLENTIVTDNTYVGKQVTLKEVVADQRILHRVDLDSAMLIEDGFLLNTTN